LGGVQGQGPCQGAALHPPKDSPFGSP